MRGVFVTASAAAIAFIGSVCPAAPAQANNFGVDINGTWRVVSDGEWARGDRGVRYKQETVVETWTVNVDCISPLECAGTVVSDRGWTGTARLDDFWYVDHNIDNWVPCPDGTFAPGHQKFLLWGFDGERNERIVKDMTFLAGRNITKSPSGACGVNAPVVIEMPVSMHKIG